MTNQYIIKLLTLVSLPYTVWTGEFTAANETQNIPGMLYTKISAFYQTLNYAQLLEQGRVCQVESAFHICNLLIPGEGQIFVAGPYLKERISTADFFFTLISNDLPVSHELNSFYHAIPLLERCKIEALAQLLSHSNGSSDILEIQQEKNLPTENHLHSQVYLWNQAEQAFSMLLSSEADLLAALNSGKQTLMKDAEEKYLIIIKNLNYDFELQYIKEHLQTGNCTYYHISNIKTRQLNRIDTIYYHFRSEIEKIKTTESAWLLHKDMYNAYGSLVAAHSYEDYPHLVQRTLQYINERWRQKLTLDEIADALSVNKCYLSSVFNHTMQQSISAYINNLKVEWAQILLRSTSLSMADISYLCGYNDASYFGKVYKKLKGETPVQYRNGKQKNSSISGNP